jgi:hypothetical protein
LEDDFLEKEVERSYFSLRNIGIILFDMVPVEKEAVMLDGLRKLLKDPELTLPLGGMSGLLSAGWGRELGRIVSSPDQALPEPFAWVEVEVNQRFRFCYCLLFRCFINSGSRIASKEGFRDWLAAGLEAETSVSPLHACQIQMEDFLSQFVSGLFLGSKERSGCPSIRVMLADKVDFGNFDSWFRDHSRFYEYNGMLGIVSRLGSFQVGYQDDRLYGPHGLFAGMNFVCSKADYSHVAGILEEDVIHDASWLFSHYLIGAFEVLYWVVHQIERILPSWECQANDLEKKLRDALTKKTKTVRLRQFMANLGPIEDLYQKSIELLNKVESYAHSERRNMEAMSSYLSHAKPPESESLPFFGRKFNVVEDLFEGAKYRADQEHSRIDSIVHRTQSICDQCSQYTNFELQKNMRTLTWVAVIVALVVSFWEPLESFLAWILNQLAAYYPVTSCPIENELPVL